MFERRMLMLSHAARSMTKAVGNAGTYLQQKEKKRREEKWYAQLLPEVAQRRLVPTRTGTWLRSG
jgi:hypothetical protein